MLFTKLICTKILGGKNTLFSISPDTCRKVFFHHDSQFTNHRSQKICIFARFLNSLIKNTSLWKKSKLVLTVSAVSAD